MEGCIARPTHRVEEGEDAADVIQMKVRDEDLIQPGGMHAQGKQVSDGSTAHVENEDVTIAQLDQKTRCTLANAKRSGTPGTAGRDSHLVLSQALLPRDVVLGVFLHGQRPLWRLLVSS